MIEQSPAPGWHVFHTMGCKYAYTIKQGSEDPPKKGPRHHVGCGSFPMDVAKMGSGHLGMGIVFSYPPQVGVDIPNKVKATPQMVK